MEQIRKSTKRITDRLVYACLFCFVVADGFITNMALASNAGYEGNPLMQPLAGTSGLILLKVLGTLCAIALLVRISKKRAQLAFGTALVFVLVYGLILTWNLRVLFGVGI